MTGNRSDHTALNYLADCVTGTEGARGLRISSVAPAGNIYVQGGITTSLTTGTNDGSVLFTKGTTLQGLKRVRVTIPGDTGTPAIIFYAAAAPTTPITGSLYLAAQPAEGFDLTGLSVTAGVLGYRITGSGGGVIGYLTVTYTY